MLNDRTELDTELFEGYHGFIDTLRADRVITRRQQSVFKDKLNHLFNVKGFEADDVAIHYAMPELSYKNIFYPERFDVTSQPNFSSHGRAVPSIHVTFVGFDSGVEHKLIVPLSINYITELPVRYFINDTCVSVIDVKNIKTIRTLIKRLIGNCK